MRIISLLVSFFIGFSAFAQIPLVPVQALQTHVAQNLANCDDSPNPLYFQDTVRVRVIVLANGAISGTSSNRWFWGRDVNATPTTPFANINIRYNFNVPTTPNDIRDLVIGDTVEVTGILDEFAAPANFFHETQLVPLETGVRIIGEDVGSAPAPRLTNIQELNGNVTSNNQPANNLVTGEPLEGNYIEIRDVEVVRLDAGVADRFRFLVRDANNNHIWIFDKFPTIRPANPAFTRPGIGDRYLVIRGVVEHERNGCPNSGANNRGYMIDPFKTADLIIGSAAPSITNLSRNPVTPTSTQTVAISANITDDGLVASATLFYAVGAANTQYAQVAMTNSAGSTYSATIPAQADGSVVKYYISAVDSSANRTTFPNVPNNINPLFYWVSDAGTTISIIQRTPFTANLNSFGGNSGYNGLDVTVEGVVTSTASATNLGSVYIQQEGQSAWAGIWLAAATSLNTAQIGDKIRVTATVQENFNMTRLNAITNVQTISAGNNTILATQLPPGTFASATSPDCEQYEGMLVRIQGAGSEVLYVVDTNTNATGTQNFGDYRVNTDQFDPTNGTAVLAGRQTSNTFSSLAVSYINNNRWATQDGAITVPVIVVQLGQQFRSITGILYYGFGQYKLLPRNNDDFQLPTSARSAVSGSLRVYPNPTSNRLTVENLTNATALKVSLTDVVGRQIFAKQLTGTQTEIQLKDLKSGTYYLHVSDAQGAWLKTEKITID